VHEVDMTKCLILSLDEWAEKKNKEKIVVEKLILKLANLLALNQYH